MNWLRKWFRADLPPSPTETDIEEARADHELHEKLLQQQQDLAERVSLIEKHGVLITAPTLRQRHG